MTLSIVRTAFHTVLAGLLAAAAFVASAAAVDVNRAAEAELQAVKGVGSGMASRIVAARSQGSFKDWSDLVERVPGMGARKAAKVSQAGLTVNGSVFDAQRYSGAKGTKGAKGAKTAKAPKTPKAPKAERSTGARRAASAATGGALGAFGNTGASTGQ